MFYKFPCLKFSSFSLFESIFDFNSFNNFEFAFKKHLFWIKLVLEFPALLSQIKPHIEKYLPEKADDDEIVETTKYR